MFQSIDERVRPWWQPCMQFHIFFHSKAIGKNLHKMVKLGFETLRKIKPWRKSSGYSVAKRAFDRIFPASRMLRWMDTISLSHQIAEKSVDLLLNYMRMFQWVCKDSNIWIVVFIALVKEQHKCDDTTLITSFDKVSKKPYEKSVKIDGPNQSRLIDHSALSTEKKYKRFVLI